MRPFPKAFAIKSGCFLFFVVVWAVTSHVVSLRIPPPSCRR